MESNSANVNYVQIVECPTCGRCPTCGNYRPKWNITYTTPTTPGYWDVNTQTGERKWVPTTYYPTPSGNTDGK